MQNYWSNNCFYHMMLCISAANAIMCCLSICPPVTFVYSVKMSKNLQMFSPSGSHTILVFPYQTAWQYSDRNTLREASNASGVWKKSLFLTNILLHRMLSTARPSGVVNKSAARPWQVGDTGSIKWRHFWLQETDNEELCTSKSCLW